MTQNNFQIDSATVSDRGLSEKRPQNEDSYLEQAERGLFAVADGVGGAQAGDVASQMAVEILSEAFANLRESGDPEETMRLAVERANQSIYQMAHDLPQLSTMATTVVALHVAGNIATIGHVGDSRLYRLDAQGKLNRETNDHSVVEEEMRAGRLTAAQAANHPNRNIISRAVGADATVEVDTKTIMFEPHTTFLLCSDGITRHIEDFQIRELLNTADTPSNITQKMKRICYERGAEDNLTAVIVRITAAAESVALGELGARILPNAELEEATVATPRRSALIIDDSAAQTSALEEIPTGELSAPIAANQTAPLNNTERREVGIPAVAPGHAPQTFEDEETIVKPATAVKSVVPVVSQKVVEEETPTSRTNGGGSKLLGKMLSALMWLIIGGIVGAGLHYLFLQNNKTPDAPVSTAIQTPPGDYAVFENNRRRVDDNPKQFIAAVAAPPEGAENSYLLGRAYLLGGRFTEAEQMFLRAKQQFGQTSNPNDKLLANDIEIGLAAVGNSAAQSDLRKVSDAVDSQTDSNSFVNQSPNKANVSTTGNSQTP